MTYALTKIRPPRPRVALVERAPLLARIAEALATRRVVLLCAPGGYGKTTLLAEALSRLPAGHAVAWISADPGDGLQRLAECTLAALEPFDPPWRVAPEALLAKLGRGTEDDEREAAAEIINTLDACDVPHGAIAFDDLHRVADPAFFRFLDRLIERMSPRWTLALSSRADPPIALARLRASDGLAEFRQLQLQLARDEARRMAAAAGLDQAVADRVFDRTQGWPAGLRMAIGAVRADGAGNAAAAPQAIERALRTGDRPMFEFLLTEVLGELPPELAEFMLRVSVLPELEARRCAEVARTPHAAALLDAIERLGLFVDVLDAPVRTLRLHDLLRDALQQRLALERPALLDELRGRAADTEPDPERRIALRLDAGDYARAAREVYEHVPPIVPTAGTAGALRLIDRFPAEFRERSPELAFVQGLALWVHWDFPGMLEALERAERAFLAAGDEARARHALAFRAHGLIAEGMLDEAIRALDALARAPLSRETRIVMLNAQSWLDIDMGRLRAVAANVEEKIDLLEKAGRIELWYHTTPPNRMPWLPGILKPLMRHADALLRVAGDESMSLRSLALLVQAWCAASQGRLREAEELRRRAQEDAAWTGSTGAVIGHLHALTAVLRAIEGDGAAALDAALARVRTLQGGYGASGRYSLVMLAARVAAACGNAAALREILDQMAALQRQFDPRDEAPRTLPHRPLAAQLAWLEGRAGDAIAGWRDALVHEEAIDLFGQASEVRVRLARALVRRGDVAGAAAAIAPAFERAASDDAPGGVLLAGDALRELAGVDWGGALAASRRASLLSWVRMVDAGTAPPPTAPAPSPGVRPVAPPAGESLSPREQDVLRRIAAGESNKAIARALDLSPHTVKRHVANILGKLGVDTRGQASARYRERAG